MTLATGIVQSILNNQSPDLNSLLQLLLNTVNEFWPEIVNYLSQLETIECGSEATKKLLNLIISKLYFNLQEHKSSLEFALLADDLLVQLIKQNRPEDSDYVQTIISECIHEYLNNKNSLKISKVIDFLFNTYSSDEIGLIVGLGLESKNIALVEKILKSNTGLITLFYEMVGDLIDYSFKKECYKLIVNLANGNKDYKILFISLKCLVELKKYSDVFTLLNSLDPLICLQLSLDLDRIISVDVSSDLLKILDDSDSTITDSVKKSKLRTIFSRDLVIDLELEFLYKNNKTDLVMLKQLKSSVSSGSLFHSGVSLVNGYCNYGSGNDQFLRDNLEWLSKATNWARFTATAQLGVVHFGNLRNKNGFKVLEPYLPKETGSVGTSVYIDGGALFALGLIYTKDVGNVEICSYLDGFLKSSSEVVLHGCCLGLGLASMGGCNLDYFGKMKSILFNDNAVAGEAAAVGMGLIMLGSGNRECIDEMLQYAHETQHEKIIRGLAIGIGLIMYGKEDLANPIIELMLSDKDGLIRYSACITMSLAYVGTGSNYAIQKLLTLAVSDVVDDVRRQAVASLGFVLCKRESQVPKYGSCMALAVACAGTGNKEALDLLEPLTKDSSDFVRQGAFIAVSMILVEQQVDSKYREQQNTETNDPKAKTKSEEKEKKIPSNVNRPAYYRKHFMDIISAKHEDSLAKFGAIIGSGIIEAGGRNVVISMLNNSSVVIRNSVVGLLFFTQFWWWFPFGHFLSLAFQPTYIVGLNKDLKMIKMDFKSNAKESAFSYPPPMKPQQAEKIEKVQTAVLSTTAKAKRHQKKTDDKKEPEIKDEKMEDVVPTSAVVEEANFTMIPNLSRVVLAQAKVVELTNERYKLIKPVGDEGLSGILILNDTKAGEMSEEIIEFSIPNVDQQASKGNSADNEASAPEPFEYVE